jgi:manganese efflux pump family protein
MPHGLHPVELLLVSLSISLDSFAAALALGTAIPRHRRWRVPPVFALFGGGFPMLGVVLGSWLSNTVQQFARLASAGVLAAVGLWMLRSAWSAFRDSDDDGDARSARGVALPLLAAGLSMDNLAVGLGLGLHGAHTLWLGAAAGAAVLAATWLGLLLGAHGHARWRIGALFGAAGLLLGLGVAVAFDWL